jgi:hypothetical protein
MLTSIAIAYALGNVHPTPCQGRNIERCAALIDALEDAGVRFSDGGVSSAAHRADQHRHTQRGRGMSAGQVLNSHRQAILEKICSWGRSPATISETEIAQGADRDGIDAPRAILASSVKVQMWQCFCNDCRFKALTLCRRGVEMQSDSHLDLVTAILARPDVTDFVVAHVC